MALTSISVAGTASLARSGIVADTIAVDVTGAERIGAGCTLTEAGGWGKGLILTDLQLTRDELVQAASESAGGEESGCSKAERMHFDFARGKNESWSE